jgi:hypothetical protein
MFYRTLRGAISLDVDVFGGLSSQALISTRNSLSVPALHCPLLSLMRSNSTGILNIEGIKIYNNSGESAS